MQQAVRGMRDILGSTSAAMQFIRTTALDLARRYDYSLVSTIRLPQSPL